MSRSNKLIITVDGPAGAGKSTLARRLARELGYTYLDTGAIYRTVAYVASQHKVSLESEDQLRDIALQIANNGSLKLEAAPNGTKVLLEGVDISKEIRTPEISRHASAVSAFPQVRAALLQLQQNMGQQGGIVVEGRDTGTVVFPHADVKFFMTASATKRAERRVAELEAKGQKADFQQMLVQIEQRDERDMQRQAAPLCQAPDAIELDTTSLNIEQVLAKMLELLREKME